MTSSRPSRHSRQVFTRSQVAAAAMLIILPLAALLQGFWVGRQKVDIKPIVFRFPAEEIECPYCGGAGTIRDPASAAVLLCPICYGVGGKHVRKLNEETELLCPACVGMGRVYDVDTGHARVCMRCEGRGLIEVSAGRIPGFSVQGDSPRPISPGAASLRDFSTP